MVKASLGNFLVVGFMAAVFILLFKSIILTTGVSNDVKSVVMAI